MPNQKTNINLRERLSRIGTELFSRKTRQASIRLQKQKIILSQLERSTQNMQNDLKIIDNLNTQLNNAFMNNDTSRSDEILKLFMSITVRDYEDLGDLPGCRTFSAYLPRHRSSIEYRKKLYSNPNIIQAENLLESHITKEGRSIVFTNVYILNEETINGTKLDSMLVLNHSDIRVYQNLSLHQELMKSYDHVLNKILIHFATARNQTALLLLSDGRINDAIIKYEDVISLCQDFPNTWIANQIINNCKREIYSIKKGQQPLEGNYTRSVVQIGRVLTSIQQSSDVFDQTAKPVSIAPSIRM